VFALPLPNSSEINHRTFNSVPFYWVSRRYQQETNSMFISDTIGRVAAINPLVGVAVAQQSTKSALLAGIETGDTQTTALLGAISGRALEANQLQASLTPNLGQNVNTVA
jgi:hypothetical protein